MKEFHDPENPKPWHWAAVRQADVHEVGRRLRRTGMQHVRVFPDLLAVAFVDPLANARVRLDMWPAKGGKGWYWDAYVCVPKSHIMGALPWGRSIVYQPWPREVVRAYLEMVAYERRSPRRKIR